MRQRTLLFGLAMLASLASAGQFSDWRQDRVMMDSLLHLPPNMRFYELERRGYCSRRESAPLRDSGGLRLVGKWGGGPSTKVTGKDSLVFLSRGSEVVVINCADPASPRVLSFIQTPGLVARSILAGDRLYVSSGYIETFDISDPSNPIKLGSVLARAPAIDVVDTLVYMVYRDSFKILNFADPANPQMLGACRDSGYDISVCEGHAYIADRWGLYVVDVTNPTSPHRVTSWGTDIYSVKARNSICCITEGTGQSSELRFTVLDIHNPASLLPLGTIDSCGGYDMYLSGQFLFISGYYTGRHEFRIVDIADSTYPRAIGSCRTEGDNFGVWANPGGSRAYVADDLRGLAVIDVGNPSLPSVDTVILGAGLSEDIVVDGHLAYVANDGFGLIILDVSNPAVPVQIGALDSTRDMVCEAVAVRDSFAFMGWAPGIPHLRTVDVSNPMQPATTGGVSVFNWPEALALRDSLLYVAEVARFQVVNVAYPRNPVLVGSCVTGDLHMAGLWLADSFAYVAGAYNGLYIINIADPENPTVARVLGGVSAWGCCVRETLLYVSDFDDSLHIWSVANLSNIRQVGSVRVNGGNSGYDVKVSGDFAYVGTAYGLGVVEVSDPRNPEYLGCYGTPDDVRRIVCDSEYVYAACWSAGVFIFNMLPSGIAEPGQHWTNGVDVIARPSVSRGRVTVRAEGRRNLGWSLWDAAGRIVLKRRVEPGQVSWPINLAQVPTGAYWLEVRSDKGISRTKLVRP